MAAGVTQPGGAGTTIYIYDNASSASGTGYTFAEISAAFPADFIDNGTNAKTYRAKVTLQIGDTGTGTAATTLVDTGSTVVWDSTKTLAWRATQVTSWTLNLGTKIGTGSVATGRNGTALYFGAATTFRGNWAIYGSVLYQKANAALTIAPLSAGCTTEIIDCIVGSEAVGGSTQIISLGTAAAPATTAYNVDLWVSGNTYAALGALNVGTCERITLGNAGTPAGGINSSQSSISVKDILFFGTPLTADCIVQGGGTKTWTLVKPVWSGGTKTAGTSATAVINEYWLYNVKVVDGNGNGLSGIPVKLTDASSTVQVNTTTDANGRISFGSGVTANAVLVRQYNASFTDKSPFLLEVNTGAGANTAYPSQRYYFNWPGITTGVFSDVNDMIWLQPASGQTTTWTEATL